MGGVLPGRSFGVVGGVDKMEEFFGRTTGLGVSGMESGWCNGCRGE